MIINLLEVQNLWRSKLKERESLQKKKAKRQAKDSSIKKELKEPILDASKPITLDFLTNPDKK